MAGPEFAKKMEPLSIPWNEHSVLHYALEPNSSILFLVSNPTNARCSVHLVLTDSSNRSKKVTSEARVVLPGESVWFEPSSFVEKRQDQDKGFALETNANGNVKMPQVQGKVDSSDTPEENPENAFPRNLYGGALVTAYVRPLPWEVDRGYLDNLCEKWDPVNWIATCFGFPSSSSATDEPRVPPPVAAAYRIEASLKVQTGEAHYSRGRRL